MLTDQQQTQVKTQKKLDFIPEREDENIIIVNVNCALPAVHEQSISRIFCGQNQVYLKIPGCFFFSISLISLWLYYFNCRGMRG